MAIGDKTSGPLGAKAKRNTVTIDEDLITNVLASIEGAGRNTQFIRAQLAGRLGEEIDVTDPRLQGFDPSTPVTGGLDPGKLEGQADPTAGIGAPPTQGPGKEEDSGGTPEEVEAGKKRQRRREQLNVATTPLGVLGRTRTRRRRLLGA